MDATVPPTHTGAEQNSVSLGKPSNSETHIILFTDLVGSTAWKQLLGDRDYTSNLRIPHDSLFRELLRKYPGAIERDNAGDGFLATFATPSDAVNFALDFHQSLAAHNWSEAIRSQSLPTTRIGIHLGEVSTIQESTGERVVGQAVDLTARVMSLATGGQTLLTRHVFDSARQHIRQETLFWANHNLYRCSGYDDPMEICQVGHGKQPDQPPADTEKVKRVIIDPQDDTGSWRPARGQVIPGRENWLLEDELGHGGFGEVWLARNKQTKQLRVFKFCFDAQRLRSFKRELTFFKLIQNQLGDRPDFVKLHEVRIDRLPYFLESDYVAEGNLVDWNQKQPAGMAGWPLESRLRFFTETAQAVAAAHSLGIIHKDLKPSNILVRLDGAGIAHPVLADFGIGILADSTRLREGQITERGFTETLLAANDSSRTGTRLYAPPEALLGKPATTLWDVYALGVLLYQLIVGHFERPLGTGWEHAIELDDSVLGELLREDVAEATQQDPAQRLATADLLAQHVGQLDQRVVERKATLLRHRRRKRMQVLGAAAAIALVALSIGLGVAVWQWDVARTERDAKDVALKAEEKAREQAFAALRSMTTDVVERKFAQGTVLTEDDKAFLRSVIAQYEAFAAIRGDDAESRSIRAEGRYRVGNIRYKLGELKDAEADYNAALDIQKQVAADFPNRPEFAHGLAMSFFNRGALFSDTGRLHEALSGYDAALGIQKQLVADFPARPEFRQELASSYLSRGLLFSRTGRLQEAEADYQTALTIFKQLVVDFPNRPEFRQVLARNHHNRGALLYGTGRLSEALADYEAALRIQKQLVSDFPSRPEFREELAMSHNNRCALMYNTGRLPQALADIDSALRIQKQLAADFPTRPEFRQTLASSQSNRGLLLSSTGRLQEAISEFEAALAILKQLVADFPTRPEFRQDLASIQNNRGFLLSKTNRLNEALADYEAALGLQKQLAADFPTRPEFRQVLARSHNNKGLLLKDKGRLEEAMIDYEAALSIQKQLAADFPTRPEFRQDLASNHANRGILLKDKGQLEEALVDYEAALGIYKKLASEFPNRPDRHNSLAGTCVNMAILQIQRKNWTDAKRLLLEGKPHHLNALQANPTNPTYREFYHNHLNALSRAHAGLLEHKEALKTAETRRDVGWNPATDAYEAAFLLAASSFTVNFHPKLTESQRQEAVKLYADHVMAMLQSAVEKGYKDVAQLKKNRDFALLREREDFKKLIAESEKRVK